MEQRTLGKSGPTVSVAGLGCNNFGGRCDLEASRRIVHKALDLGITLFDTADMYGNRGLSEDYLGQILGTRRRDVVLATKFGFPMDDSGKMKGASRAYIMTAVEASLKRLRTDYIDLYQLHRPDPETPIEETLRALDDLLHQGKVRSIGSSNFTAAQVDEAQLVADRAGLAPFISCQNEYSLVMRSVEPELVPAMTRLGLGLLPYFPLASGFLTGKYKRDVPPPEGTRMKEWSQYSDKYLNAENWRILGELEAFCTRRGRTLLELAFGWLAAKPAVASVIAGATKPEQVEQNVRAVAWRLSPDDVAEVDRITAKPVAA